MDNVLAFLIEFVIILQGGESYKQTIRANLTDETVTLNFDSNDGGSTLMVIDFRNVSFFGVFACYEHNFNCLIKIV